MHRRLRRAYNAVVEQGCTKIATATCLSHLDLIVARATSLDDVPLPEHYVWELTTIFSSSPTCSRAFALSFTRRFGRTKCWRVALKSLLLLHRILRTLPSDHPFHAELLGARANALISLHPCRFRDASSSSSEDFTVFIQSYSHLLDEILSCAHSITGETYAQPSPPPHGTFPERMKEVGRALELIPQLQSLVDRTMECRPANEAARSFLVRSAMKQIARDSFACYLAARQGLELILDGILQMPYSSCVAGLGVYKRAAEQADRLGEFYQWCKMMEFCGPYEYPLVEKIPHIQVRMLESFVEQMWQMTESSSTSSPITSSSTPSTDVEGNKDLEIVKKVVINEEWEKFEEESEEEEEPLIKFAEDDESSWEVLLEASVHFPWTPWNFYDPWKSQSREDERDGVKCEKGNWKLQVYNPYPFNPFF